MESSPHTSQDYPSNQRTIGAATYRHEARESDVYIAVMGVTGAGKSTFISHLTDSKVQVGDGLNACTQHVEMYPCKHSGLVNIWLVDTPGFDDTHRSDTDVLREIARWLTESLADNKVILNGMIYLHRITDVRMQGSAMKNLYMFKKLCGPNALKNVILATTMWEQVSPEHGERREQELMRTSEFWGEMILRGAQVKRHYNNADSAWSLVDVFASKGSTKRKAVLTIQEEMVIQHKTLDKTDAGRELESSLIREREKWSRELKETKEMMHEALKAKDKESLEQLRETEAKMNKKIEAVELAREELKVGMQKMYKKDISKVRLELAQQSLYNRGALEKLEEMQKALELMKLQSEEEEEQDEEEDEEENDPRQVTAAEPHPDYETGSIACPPIKGEVGLSLSGSCYFLSGSKYCYWKTSEGQPLLAGGESIGYGAVGENGALYLHYHKKNTCWTERNDSFVREYPKLEESITSKELFGCPRSVSLGTDGHYVFSADGRTQWSLPKEITDLVPRVNQIRSFARGFNGAFVTIKKDGEIIYDLKGQYGELNDHLQAARSRGWGVKNVALNLENGQAWALIWERGGANWFLSGELLNYHFEDFMRENSQK